MMTPFIYWLAVKLARYLVLPLYTRITICGLEKVPACGPIVIAANHLNDADPAIIACVIPRRIAFMAKVEIFRVPLLGRIARAVGGIPVRRNQADLSALRKANDVLARGLALGIFPEGGTSTAEARLRQAWPGVALLALRNNTPVLPVAITGSQDLQWPAMFWRLLRPCDVAVRIGEPFRLPRPQRINAESAEAATQVIMETIAALLPPQYRGYYGADTTAAGAVREGEGS